MISNGKWVLGLLLSVFFVMAGCADKTIPDSTDWPVKPFTFTNQNQQDISSEDLKGKIWVADFMFTTCADVCLPMTSNMAKLQKKLKEEGIKDVEFVSFSVDPKVDTPAVLKSFADQFNIDYANWQFLTGYEQSYIEKFAADQFHTLVKKPETGDQVIHGTDVYLVNQEGKIVKSYSGVKDFPLDEIIEHIHILQKS
ncbi:SCO family protein [Bacillus sp. 1P06AnD]|uniref:SCO family protein n=1 Tax=Bacillus sp. 1P06AnD TaxID=3132208 RepID=UPI0039A32BC9